MSDEQFIVNDGDAAKLVPVEVKEPTLAVEQKPLVEKKKRGRPTKKTSVKEDLLPEWYCSTCRENISDKNVMRIGAGTNRFAIFCPQCQRSFGFQDQEFTDKVDALIKNNAANK